MQLQLEKGQTPAGSWERELALPSRPAAGRSRQSWLPSRAAPVSSGARAHIAAAQMVSDTPHPTRQQLSSPPGEALAGKRTNPWDAKPLPTGSPRQERPCPSPGEEAQGQHAAGTGTALLTTELSCCGALGCDTRLLQGTGWHRVPLPSLPKPCGCASQPTAGPCSHPGTRPGPEPAALSGPLAGAGAGSGLGPALPVGAGNAVPAPAVRASAPQARCINAGASSYAPSAALGSGRGALLPPRPPQQPRPYPPPCTYSPVLNNIFMTVLDPHSGSLGGCLCMTSPSPSRKSGTGPCIAMTHS